MRRKKADDQGAPASAEGRITPTEVQSVEFRLSFRGYNERDVDAFLDRITEDLSAYLEELSRLRGGQPPALAASGEGRGDADGIVAQARAQAAAIVRQAEQEAAAIRAGAAAGSGDTRAAVAPFLNKEREFLQGLGGLVQAHAEEIKQMVVALRSRAEAAGSAAGAAVPSAAPTAPTEPRSGQDGASAAEIRERLGEPEPPAPAPSSASPIVIDAATEPAFSSEGAQPNDGRERSLRELFWGED